MIGIINCVKYLRNDSIIDKITTISSVFGRSVIFDKAKYITENIVGLYNVLHIKHSIVIVVFGLYTCRLGGGGSDI